MISKVKLLELGFIEIFVTREESGSNSYYYYVYELNNNTILISNSSDTCINGKYSVSFFNYMDFSDIIDEKLLVELIELLNKVNSKNNER